MSLTSAGNAWKTDKYPLIDKEFDFQMDQNGVSELESLFTDVDAKQESYRIQQLGGFAELPVVPNGSTELQSMDQSRGFITEIIPKVRAGFASMTKHDADTNLLYNIQRIGRECADACDATVSLQRMRLFANAFNKDYVGGDGKPWAATDHYVASKADKAGKSVPDTSKGTYSNLIHNKLSAEAIYRTAWPMAKRFKTPSGLPLMADFRRFGVLLVSIELEGEAMKLCGVDSKNPPQHLPGSADNDANPLQGLTYVVIGGGDEGFTAGQWAVADRRNLKKSTICHFIRRPELDRVNHESPHILGVSPYVDMEVGFGDGRSIIFSDSTGAANS